MSGSGARLHRCRRTALWGRTAGLALCVVGFTSCVEYQSFPTVKPIAPVAKHGNQVVCVGSLQPTLRWRLSRGSPGADTAYDLVIHEARLARDYYGALGWVARQLVYRRDGLKQAEHRVEISLQPATNFIWAIRYHQGAKVSDWSTYNYNSAVIAPGIGGALASSTTRHRPFVFSTPAFPRSGTKLGSRLFVAR